MADIEEWAEDCIYTGVEAHLDWKDRLLVLFGRPLHVDVRVSVEHAPGRTHGTSKVWAERVVMPWEYRGGYAEAPR